MTNRNVSGNGKFTGGLVLCAPARQTVPATLERGRTRIEMLRTDTTTQSDKDKRPCLDWQMVALWIFIAVSFAALACTGYLIWAKCRSELPF